MGVYRLTGNYSSAGKSESPSYQAPTPYASTINRLLCFKSLLCAFLMIYLAEVN